MPAIEHECAVSCQGVQIHHFMTERSQVLHESLLNFKVEGSYSKMASIGKADSIETALQGHGNIRGSGSNNGVSFCILAGTAEHILPDFSATGGFIHNPHQPIHHRSVGLARAGPGGTTTSGWVSISLIPSGSGRKSTHCDCVLCHC